MRTIVWFRGKDLRVRDHAPLRAAAEAGDVIPLFVLDPFFFARPEELPHRMQFLAQSLRELADAVRSLGSELLIAEGRSVDVVPRLFREWKADRVFAHRWTEPFGRERDRRIAEQVPLELWEGELLHVPGSLRTQSGGMFRVFTPFYNAFRSRMSVGTPQPAPALRPPPVTFKSVAIPDVAVNANVIAGGEAAAHKRLRAAMKLKDYAHSRDDMGDTSGTSHLSADLKFGTVSVRTVWHAIEDAGYRRQLVWREFSHQLLWEQPTLLREPFRPEWANFPWQENDAGWEAWVNGTTGYPLVDAAARQLLAEGYVHNRARMLAASFLTKHLLIDYKRGEAHYMKYLVDGDWAQNNMGWQWSAGCGCDAQPWFRIFNPITQGDKFDSAAHYINKWVPEARGSHEPYKKPIVDHKEARERFLAVAKTALGSMPIA